MDYSKMIEMDNVTIEDCIDLFEKNKRIIINDGKIVNFIEEGE